MSSISDSSSSTYISGSTSSSSTTDRGQSLELKNLGDHCVTQELKGKKNLSELFKTGTNSYLQKRTDYNTSILLSTLIEVFAKNGLTFPVFPNEQLDCIETILSQCSISFFPSLLDLLFHDLYFDFKRSTELYTTNPVCYFYVKKTCVNTTPETILRMFAEQAGKLFLSILDNEKGRRMASTPDTLDALQAIIRKDSPQKSDFSRDVIESFRTILAMLKKAVRDLPEGVASSEKRRLSIKIEIIESLLMLKNNQVLFTTGLSSLVFLPSPVASKSPMTEPLFTLESVFTSGEIQGNSDEDFLLDLIDFHLISMGSSLYEGFRPIFLKIREMIISSKDTHDCNKLLTYLDDQFFIEINAVTAAIKVRARNQQSTAIEYIRFLIGNSFTIYIEGVIIGTLKHKKTVVVFDRIRISLESFIVFFGKLKEGNNKINNSFIKIIYDIFGNKGKAQEFLDHSETLIDYFSRSKTGNFSLQDIFSLVKSTPIVFDKTKTISLLKDLHNTYSTEITNFYNKNNSDPRILQTKENYFNNSIRLLPLFSSFHDITNFKNNDFSKEDDFDFIFNNLIDYLDLEIDTTDLTPEELELPYNREEDDDSTTSFLPLSSYSTPLPPASSFSSSSSLSLPLTSSSLSSLSVPSISSSSLPSTRDLLSSSSSSSLFPPSTSSSSSTTRPTPRTLQQASSFSSSSPSISRADAIEKFKNMKKLKKKRNLIKYLREEKNLVASSKNSGSGHTTVSTPKGEIKTSVGNHGPGTTFKPGTLFKLLKKTE